MKNRFAVVLLALGFSSCAYSAMDVSGIQFCQLLSHKAEVTARAKVQGMSKAQFIKEARIADDADIYSQDFHEMEMTMIDDIYRNAKLIHKPDNYENIRASSEYSLKVMDVCLKKYGKVDHVVFH